jgi:hypothetical protein
VKPLPEQYACACESEVRPVARQLALTLETVFVPTIVVQALGVE